MGRKLASKRSHKYRHGDSKRKKMRLYSRAPTALTNDKPQLEGRLGQLWVSCSRFQTTQIYTAISVSDLVLNLFADAWLVDSAELVFVVFNSGQVRIFILCIWLINKLLCLAGLIGMRINRFYWITMRWVWSQTQISQRTTSASAHWRYKSTVLFCGHAQLLIGKMNRRGLCLDI